MKIPNTALLLLGISLAAFMLACFVQSLDKQVIVAESGVVSLNRAKDSNNADKPSGVIRMRITNSSTKSDAPADRALPPEDISEPPVEPDEPGEEEEDKPRPEFFGEPLGSIFLWVLDFSTSMDSSDITAGEDYDGNTVGKPSRIGVVRVECVKVLKQLTEEDQFDMVLLAGEAPNVTPVTDVWQGRLVQASSSAVKAAIEYVKYLQVWGSTPTHKALHRACTEYGNEIDTLIFLSDGVPFPLKMDNGRNHKQAVLDDFPAWYAPLKAYGCKLICVEVGHDRQAHGFMQNFAAQNNGSFVHRE